MPFSYFSSFFSFFVFSTQKNLNTLLKNNLKLNIFGNISKFPKKLKKFIVQKGSISLNGISLTINEVKSNKCHCMIIPHTYKYTDIHTYKKNEILNLEVDMLARYAHSSKS